MGPVDHLVLGTSEAQVTTLPTPPSSLFSSGSADCNSDEVKNAWKERAMHYAVMDDTHLPEHVLNLYGWVSVVGVCWVDLEIDYYIGG